MTAIAEVIKKMIADSDHNLHDVNHFMKVWGYAKTIGELEGLDPETQLILEIAAVTHDIACPLCREKYGNTNGKLQEKEGILLVPEFLKSFDLTEEAIRRVTYLVGHHHTYSEVDGKDYQILLEADYLVNADESSYTPDNIKKFCEKVFKTQAGTALLKSMFLFS